MSAVDASLAHLESIRPPGPSGFLDEIREVILVASSSRGGSTVFMELLRLAPTLLHFQAEINPFLVLAGLGWPGSGSGSDRLTADHAEENRARLDGLLAPDLGGAEIAPVASAPAGSPLDDVERERFARHLCWRLHVQWPLERFAVADVRRWLDAALEPVTCRPGWGVSERQRFHLRFLARVRARHPAVNPYYYDLDAAGVAERFPELTPPVGPPSACVIEEPPFVLIAPWRAVDPALLARRPLVIKTPSNAYRLRFLAALFPNARLRVIHLVRSPAAAINGLVDGWRYRGFHAHRVPAPLRIRGYADACPADAWWWKYDLPPGWEDWTGAHLEQVCGFQWRSAHASTLEWLAQSGADHHRMRFEEVIASPERRALAFGELFAWLGQPPPPRESVLAGLPPVMATARPRHRRWFDKAEQLEPVLARPEIIHLARRLGYEGRGEWI